MTFGALDKTVAKIRFKIFTEIRAPCQDFREIQSSIGSICYRGAILLLTLTLGLLAVN